MYRVFFLCVLELDDTTLFSTSLTLLPLDLLDESILLDDGILDLDGVSKENIGVLYFPT